MINRIEIDKLKIKLEQHEENCTECETALWNCCCGAEFYINCTCSTYCVVGHELHQKWSLAEQDFNK